VDCGYASVEGGFYVGRDGGVVSWLGVVAGGAGGSVFRDGRGVGRILGVYTIHRTKCEIVNTIVDTLYLYDNINIIEGT